MGVTVTVHLITLVGYGVPVTVHLIALERTAVRLGGTLAFLRSCLCTTVEHMPASSSPASAGEEAYAAGR